MKETGKGGILLIGKPILFFYIQFRMAAKEKAVPVISRFFGIVIYMFWRDHAPAHFHAKYQDAEITVEVESGLVTGQMGRKAIALIQEWREIRKNELMQDWELARQKMALHPIDPLE